jgi:hypothetical protein
MQASRESTPGASKIISAWSLFIIADTKMPFFANSMPVFLFLKAQNLFI